MAACQKCIPSYCKLVVNDKDTYSVYLNGKLYLGCERSSIGEPFRFSNVNIRSLTASGTALNTEEVAALYE